MMKLVNKNTCTVRSRSIPQLRFPEFKGEWVKKKLGVVAEKIGDGLHGTPVYSDNSDIYFINGNNLTNGKIEITETTKKVDIVTFTKNDKKLNKNTLLISINGTIGNVAKYNNEKVMLGKSVAYFNFIQNIDFYYYVFNTETVQNFFISELTGSTIKNLSLKTLRETEISFPSLPEQTRISQFFTAIDQKITQIKQKKTLLEQYKKGVMQKIFSQEIKFKDEDGKEFPKWVEIKFAEIYSFISTNSYSRENLNYNDGEIKNIHYGDIHTKFQVKFDLLKEYVPFINSEINVRIPADNYCKEGDLVIADASEDYIDIGKNIELVNLNKQKVVAGLHTILARPNLSLMHLGFGAFLMKSSDVRKQIMFIAQGTKVLSISVNRLAKLELKLPSKQEQVKIANFLTAIDEKINYCQMQIEKTEQWKKGLLQQMFC